MVTAGENLESALQRAWRWEALAEYATHLRSQGDPRGELIELDLHPAEDRAWRRARRRALDAWLGEALAGRCGHLVQYGFVQELRGGQEALELLETPLGEVVRSLATWAPGRSEGTSALAQIARRVRPWLSQLALFDWSGALYGTDVSDRLIAATPNLLELESTDLFSELVHPHLRRWKIHRVSEGRPSERKVTTAVHTALEERIAVPRTRGSDLEDDLQLALEIVELNGDWKSAVTEYGPRIDGGELLSTVFARLATAGLVEIDGPWIRLSSAGRAVRRHASTFSPPTYRRVPPDDLGNRKWVLWTHDGPVRRHGLVHVFVDLLRDCLEQLPLIEATRSALVDLLDFLASVVEGGEERLTWLEAPSPAANALDALIELHGIAAFSNIGDESSWSALRGLAETLDSARKRRVEFSVAWGF